MKTITLRNGYFTLLIIVVIVVTVVTGLFMLNLYKIYTNLVYSESEEILNLYAIIANQRLSDLEHLSFEVLSNKDFQYNLLKYVDATDSFQAYQATNDLYTQIFTRWIMNPAVLSISFSFLDGRRVDAGHLQEANITDQVMEQLINSALTLEGSCAWAANVAGENTVTLYRLIRDISGNKFRPLGTLVINVAADYFLNYTPVVSTKYQPEIICLADDQVLYGMKTNIQPMELLAAVNGGAKPKKVELNGESYFMLSTQLGNNGWDLIYLLTTKELLADIAKANMTYALVFVLIVIVIALLVYGIAKAITQPLTQLTQAMKVVEDGNYSVRLDSPKAKSWFAITEVVQLTWGFSQMVSEIDRLVNDVLSKQLTIVDMKYKMLRQQINPHFLYNTLDTVNWKAIQSGNTDIAIMVKSLSKLLRGSIKGPDIITLKEDLSFVEDYINIQKIRFEERLIYQVELPEQIYDCPIPRLTLQTIVENSIVHNLEKHSQPCRVKISAAIIDGKLELYVVDNGRGVDLEYMEKVLTRQVETAGNSVGLSNIDQRIKMSFGDNYGIRIANRKPTGTIVTIVLPYEGDHFENTVNC